MLRIITQTGAFVALMAALAMMTSQAVSAAPMPQQRVYELDERDADGNFGWIVMYKPDITNITRFNRGDWLKHWYKDHHLVMAQSAHGTMKMNWNRKVFNGFSGRIADRTVEALRKDPEIEYVIRDTRMFANKLKKRSNAPWGLQRISQREPIVGGDAKGQNFTYIFDDSAGQGVDVYVIDTGVRTTHKQFGGRATWGATFGTGTPNEDKDGHGTHCAGTIAGRTVGVARNANIIAVKVLGDDGSGMTSDIISGVNYAMQAASNSSRPSVISMSLGGEGNRALDDAVRGAVAAGLHVIVAAGNEAVDAGTTSPARVKEAITVGASDINDAVAEFSNFGEVVDIFGPGVDIISASSKGDDEYQSLSGTSMATPHVAGLAAYLIALEGQRTPADMLARIQQLGSNGLLKLMPSKTRNDLAYNGAALKPEKATKPVPKVEVHPASAPIPTSTNVKLVPKVDA